MAPSQSKQFQPPPLVKCSVLDVVVDGANGGVAVVCPCSNECMFARVNGYSLARPLRIVEDIWQLVDGQGPVDQDCALCCAHYNVEKRYHNRTGTSSTVSRRQCVCCHKDFTFAWPEKIHDRHPKVKFVSRHGVESTAFVPLQALRLDAVSSALSTDDASRVACLNCCVQHFADGKLHEMPTLQEQRDAAKIIVNDAAFEVTRTTYEAITQEVESVWAKLSHEDRTRVSAEYDGIAVVIERSPHLRGHLVAVANVLVNREREAARKRADQDVPTTIPAVTSDTPVSELLSRPQVVMQAAMLVHLVIPSCRPAVNLGLSSLLSQHSPSSLNAAKAVLYGAGVLGYVCRVDGEGEEEGEGGGTDSQGGVGGPRRRRRRHPANPDRQF